MHKYIPWIVLVVAVAFFVTSYITKDYYQVTIGMLWIISWGIVHYGLEKRYKIRNDLISSENT